MTNTEQKEKKEWPIPAGRRDPVDPSLVEWYWYYPMCWE